MGANKVATFANTIAKQGFNATLAAGTAAGASFLVTLVSGTAALIANTAATVANTAVKGAAIIASYALAAGKLVLAAATFFAGAAAVQQLGHMLLLRLGVAALGHGAGLLAVPAVNQKLGVDLVHPLHALRIRHLKVYQLLPCV